jgi:hypothetical protein
MRRNNLSGYLAKTKDRTIFNTETPASLDAWRRDELEKLDTELGTVAATPTPIGSHYVKLRSQIQAMACLLYPLLLK